MPFLSISIKLKVRLGHRGRHSRRTAITRTAGRGEAGRRGVRRIRVRHSYLCDEHRTRQADGHETWGQHR